MRVPGSGDAVMLSLKGVCSVAVVVVAFGISNQPTITVPVARPPTVIGLRFPVPLPRLADPKLYS